MPITIKPDASGAPVPAEPVCRFDDIAAFVPGVWNGEPVTKQDLSHMVENYKKFSDGPDPYYRPFVSINHKDELAAGLIDGCRLDPDGTLRLDAGSVPEQVGKWRNSNQINSPSIEFWRPKRDASGKLVDGFMMPNGQYCPTPVLKSVTLLGNDAPAVKGLGPLPIARFANSRGAVHRFSSPKGNTMDRQSMLAALQAMGIDTAMITDDVPDAFLKSVLDTLQGAATPVVTPPPPADNSVVPMADDDKKKDDTGASCYADLSAPIAAGAAATPAGIGAPSAITLKFSDQSTTDAFAAYQKQVNDAIVALLTKTRQQDGEQKQVAVRAFSERMRGRYNPVQLRAICSTLLALDNSAVRKFSDGKGQGTAFAEALAMHEAAAPPAKFSDRGTGEKIGQPAAVGGGSDTGMSEERKQAMYARDPMFRDKFKAKK